MSKGIIERLSHSWSLRLAVVTNPITNPVRLLRISLMKFFLQVLSLVSWGAGNSPTPVVLDQHDLQHLQTHDQIGHQTADKPLMEEGLALVKGNESLDTYGALLRGVWLGGK